MVLLEVLKKVAKTNSFQGIPRLIRTTCSQFGPAVPKVPTEKMREYRRQMIESDFAAAKRACTKQVEKIESLLQDEFAGIAEYQKARRRLESRMNDLQEAHALLYDTLTLEEDRIQQNRLYDFNNHKNRGALRSLNEKIATLQLQGDDLAQTISRLQAFKTLHDLYFFSREKS